MTDYSLARQVLGAEPDWNDVLSRGTQLRRLQVRKRALAAAFAVAALALAAPALGVGGWLHGIVQGRPVSPTRLTAADVTLLADHTHPVSLSDLASPAARRLALDRFGLKGIRLLAVRSGVSFYAIDVRGGGECFATGRGSAENLFSSVQCASAGSNSFPSPSEPVLNQSIVGDTGSGRTSVLELAGIAANGVASVGVRGVDGFVYARTPVRSNVFVNDAVPVQATGPLVAFDVAGNTIWTQAAESGCRVRLYFVQRVRNFQIALTIAALKRDPNVIRVAFISKTAALKEMQRRYPNLVTGLKYNPLPHSISVRFRSGLSAKTVMAELRAQHLPGIGVIQSSGC